MRKHFLDEPIKPIVTLVTTGKTRVYEVPKEFPKSVREFWKLRSNSKTFPAL
jgi:hypothetical protein